MVSILVILILTGLLYYQYDKQKDQKLEFDNDYLKISEGSGTVTEQIQSSAKPCEGRLADYNVHYKNGDSLNFQYDNYFTKFFANVTDCSTYDKVYDITYITKNRNRYYVRLHPAKNGSSYLPIEYISPTGELHWTSAGEIDNNKPKNGDINEANSFISVLTIKADDILKKYNSGQMKANMAED